MNNKLIIPIAIGIALFLIHGKIFAQETVKEVLTSIEANNKTLQSVKKAGEAQMLKNGTGLTLENPQVNYDYMIGSPVAAGNQTDIVVSQSFDFPSVYSRKKALSVEKNKMTDLNYRLERQQILFEAQSICIDQIYRNKLHSQYVLRRITMEQLVDNYQKKMDKGDGTIIEINKAQLQLIEINKEMELNLGMIRQNSAKLSAMNGGNAIELTDTIYPVYTISQTFDAYYNEIALNDPLLKMVEQENEIALKQVELSKSMTLPKFELGYHYQGILGQRFNGVHAAITIPLWEHKNTIKASQATITTLELEKKAYENDRYFELKSAYEKYGTLNSTLKQYQTIFSTFSNTDLLLKALNYGEINTIEYLMELSYYYTNYDNYLQTEKELNLTIVELLKFN